MRTLCVALLACAPAWATIFGTVRGIVHDPSHRPVAGTQITIHATGSEEQHEQATDQDGEFTVTLPAGEYVLTAAHDGFVTEREAILVNSGTAPVLHIQLRLGERAESVTVEESADTVDSQTVAPTTTVTKADIRNTPGADLTNSLRMITDFVPGAYMTHDQLHVRGGHQVTWALDGVPIPNTNIASNVGPQIDPEDIDTIEVDRGGYSAEYGDRTYGVFNVVPRTGFESDRELDLSATAGSFGQTNENISFGDHTSRLAWFGNLNGNRSDYGLETPGPEIDHDRVWGLGGFGSLLFNVDAGNQLRILFSSRSDDYQIPGSYDVERERDDVATFTWVHTFTPGTLLTMAPFFHFNQADYAGDPNAVPIGTTQKHNSTYGGAQLSLNQVTEKHNWRVGAYGFGQHDSEFIRLTANDGSGLLQSASTTASGYLAAGFLEDQWKATSWLTLTGGLRATRFSGALSESAVDPRVGAALRIPRLHWVVRGYFGAYYQAPPLETVAGPIAQYAIAQGLGIIPLKGERDEENQVGLTIPWRGWTADVNSFRLRATNYFDHNNLGDSNVFLPLTIAGARIWGQEFTLRSPRLFHRSDIGIAYSYQHAEGQGAVTGGLTDFSPPPDGSFLLDHDQRHTLHGNFRSELPWRINASVSLYYGSGFTDGSAPVPAHLQAHTQGDVSIGRSFGEYLSVSAVGLNVTNRRFLQDNSSTFGGSHYADPRQWYVQLRYKLHW